MKSSPQFFCYSPRPRRAELDLFESAIIEVMGRARGIFRRGMSREFIRARLLESHSGVLGSAPSLDEISLGLRKLRGLDLVEQSASDPDLWRLKQR